MKELRADIQQLLEEQRANAKVYGGEEPNKDYRYHGITIIIIIHYDDENLSLLTVSYKFHST